MNIKRVVILAGLMVLSTNALADWFVQESDMKPIKNIGPCHQINDDLETDKNNELATLSAKGLSCMTMPKAIACSDAEGRGTIMLSVNYFTTLDACNAHVAGVKDSGSRPVTTQNSKEAGWIFSKMKSSHISERFTPCTKVKKGFEAELKSESNMWSDRGAVCATSKFYDDTQYIFECKYPRLGDTTRYYFWHDNKAKCEERLNVVKDRWKKEKLD